MKRILAIFAGALFALALNAQNNPLEVKQFELSNGMQVWLNQDKSQPIVYGAVVVRAGAKDCPDTGLAHYLEHLLFKGTEELGTVDYEAEKVWLDSIALCYDRLSTLTNDDDRKAIQKEINRLSKKAADFAIPNEFTRLIARFGGTGLNAGTSYDYTYYYNTFSPQYIEQWAELNSHRMINPVFRLFQGELETVYEEKNRGADNTIQAPLFEMIKEFSGSNPYSYQVIGSTENLKNPRLGEMMDFFNKYYVGCNMGLILSGDIDFDGLQPLLERTFGRIRRGDKPEKAPVEVEPFTGIREVKIKAEIPLIKIAVYAFNGPTDSEKDAPALDLATGLLTNSFSSGLMDSLVTGHKMLLAGAMRVPMFNEMGITGFAVVPNLPFGSLPKAEKLCWEQVRKIQNGQFSDSEVEALKLETARNAQQALETIAGRSDQMVSVMTQGRSWDEYLAQVDAIRSITRDDIIRVANKYFTDKYIRFEKVMGSYPKDNVAKPDIDPVVPQHAGESSEYAKRLEAMPVRDVAPRLVDMQRDVQRLNVTPHVKMYYKENPVNDLFRLTLRVTRGSQDDPVVPHVASFMNTLGTDSLSVQQLSKAWQALGTTLTIDSGNHSFDITISGYEDRLEESLKLLRHFIDHAVPDKDSFKELLQGIDLEKQTFFSGGTSNIMTAMQYRVMYGANSIYLNQLDKKELKAVGMKGLMQKFSDLMDHEYSVLYSGRKPAGEVAAALARRLDLGRAVKSEDWVRVDYSGYDTPTVFFYDLPGSRQMQMVTYQAFDRPQNGQEKAALEVLGEYFGGGMFSLMFQEVREFRAMAYSAHGYTSYPDPAYPNDKAIFVTNLGTQADKSLSAIQLVDSLIRTLPIKENALESARYAIVADANNDYPTFRSLPSIVQGYDRLGYTADPDKDVLDNISSIDSAALRTYYEKSVAPTPLTWIIVGDRKTLPMDEIARYGRLVELKKEDIYK
ncbi:MAG: insulinase family protein [Bacteroidales bacterium]|nr:insulinase family protein [Bacteroidales bacterium]